MPGHVADDHPTEVDQPENVDGRRARRDRNRNAVLDVVLEMFAEDALWPSIEAASKRSGLSLRSVYRYFADPDELVEAAIQRNLEQARPLGLIHQIGQGRLDHRISEFVTVRVKLYERFGPTFRATVHNASRHPRVRETLDETRRTFGHQFELQFAPELESLDRSARGAVLAAGDVLSQFDAIDLLRRARQLTVAETEATLRRALHALLTSG